MQKCVFMGSWWRPEKQNKQFPKFKRRLLNIEMRKTCVLAVLAKINMKNFNYQVQLNPGLTWLTWNLKKIDLEILDFLKQTWKKKFHWWSFEIYNKVEINKLKQAG